MSILVILNVVYSCVLLTMFFTGWWHPTFCSLSM